MRPQGRAYGHPPKPPMAGSLTSRGMTSFPSTHPARMAATSSPDGTVGIDRTGGRSSRSGHCSQIAPGEEAIRRLSHANVPPSTGEVVRRRQPSPVDFTPTRLSSWTTGEEPGVRSLGTRKQGASSVARGGDDRGRPVSSWMTAPAATCAPRSSWRDRPVDASCP